MTLKDWIRYEHRSSMTATLCMKNGIEIADITVSHVSNKWYIAMTIKSPYPLRMNNKGEIIS